VVCLIVLNVPIQRCTQMLNKPKIQKSWLFHDITAKFFEKGERGKEKRERRKEKGERRKEKRERRKEKFSFKNKKILFLKIVLHKPVR